jgi:hypothetical protein
MESRKKGFRKKPKGGGDKYLTHSAMEKRLINGVVPKGDHLRNR